MLLHQDRSNLDAAERRALLCSVRLIRARRTNVQRTGMRGLLLRALVAGFAMAPVCRGETSPEMEHIANQYADTTPVPAAPAHEAPPVLPAASGTTVAPTFPPTPVIDFSPPFDLRLYATLTDLQSNSTSMTNDQGHAFARAVVAALDITIPHGHHYMGHALNYSQASHNYSINVSAENLHLNAQAEKAICMESDHDIGNCL